MAIKLLSILLLTLMLAAMGGCNTVRGMGKDVHDSAMNVQTWIEGSNTNVAQIPPPGG